MSEASERITPGYNSGMWRGPGQSPYSGGEGQSLPEADDQRAKGGADLPYSEYFK